MTFFPVPHTAPSPLPLPDGSDDETREEVEVYTGTACLAFMDVEAVADVWEDLLYDGHGHSHGAGGLALNGAAVGTQVEHDGEFPVQVVRDIAGHVVAIRVNLDPYGDDLADVRQLDHTAAHAHVHSHDGGHTHHHHDHAHHDHHGHDEHDHGHDHHGHDHHDDHGHDGHGHDGHGGGHPEGWSPVEQIRLLSDRVVFGDPAGLPEADDTGGLVTLTFPEPGGVVSFSVFTESGLRRELRAQWAPA